MKRRVVITGIGVVSAAGVGIEPLWRALESGTSAIKNCSRFDASGFASHLVGEARDGDQPFSAKDHVPKHYRKAVKVMSKDVELAVASAKLAVEQASLFTRAKEDAPPTYPPERTSCHIGAGLIAAETEELSLAMSSATDDSGAFSLKKWGTAEGGGGGMNNLQPLWMLKYLPNMLACHVTIIHGLEGPSNTLLNGEASGLLSLGESLRIIQRGAADAGLAGSAESKVNPMGLLRLDLCGRVAHTNADATPASTVRPYAKDSTGGLVGEAGGIVVVEDESMAKARGVRIHARVAGFGAAHALVPPIPILSATCDHACPTTKFDPAAVAAVAAAGKGLAHAIAAALRDAGLTAADIDAAIPEGCGAPLPDQAEAFALREVFGPRAETLPLICPAPIIGGCAAGNGGVQAALGAHCLSTQSLPRTHRLDGTVHAPHPKETRNGSAPLRRILLCSMGVCGQCAAIVLEA